MSIEQVKKGDELTQSLDIVNENIARLKELFPEVLTEGKIDFKILQDILGKEIEEEDEYYRFTWAGKAQARREAHKPSTGTLRPAKEESVNWDTTENLYIEGDNLEVLKLLQKSYSNKVKMIYIDPPYNTGKDFVYKDNYKDNLKNYQEISGQIDNQGNKLSTNSDNDGRYHSNWLNMIYPRLKLARNLLKENGVIFISIDDNENPNLRKICDEIFGSENLINNKQLIWHIPNGTNKGFIARAHEYIIGYAKNISKLEPFKRPEELNSESIKHLTNSPGPKNKVSEIIFPKGLRYEGEDCEITGIVGGEKEPIFVKGSMIFKNGKLIEDAILESSWKNKNQIETFLKGELSIDEKGQKITEVFFKSNGKPMYVKDLAFYSPKSVQQFGGTSFENDLREELKFSNPKPVSMLKWLTFLTTNNDDIILDFFSGSSTTAHAILELNLDYNSSRKFIMVQLPENLDETLKSADINARQTIQESILVLDKLKKPHLLSEIGKERIRRAGKAIVSKKLNEIVKLKSKNSLLLEDKDHINNMQLAIDNLDVGFKVFKLDSSNIKGWDGNPDNLVDSLFDSQDNIKTGRTEEDVLFEILLKYGLDLTLPIEEKIIEGKKVFSVGFGALFICLGNDISNKVAEGIGKWKEDLNPEGCRVIFKDSGFGDVEKTNSVQTLKRFGINEIKSI